MKEIGIGLAWFMIALLVALAIEMAGADERRRAACARAEWVCAADGSRAVW